MSETHTTSPVSVSGRNVVGQTVVAVKIMLYSEGQPKHPMETKSPVLTLCFDSSFKSVITFVFHCTKSKKLALGSKCLF